MGRIMARRTKVAALRYVTFVVSGEPTAAADPCQRALDDPTFWEHDEPVAIAAADDLEFPEAGASDGGFHFPPKSLGCG